MTTRLTLPILLALLAPSACVVDRQLGETAAELRAEELRSECEDEQAGPPIAEPESLRTSPSGIAPCTPVAELNEAEKTGWCEWYATSYNHEGAPPSPGTHWVVDGKVIGGGTTSETDYCIQHIAVDHCVANLSLGGCQVPIITIERCVRSLCEGNDGDYANAGFLAESCFELLDLGLCPTTIVQQDADPPHGLPGCPVPIE